MEVMMYPLVLAIHNVVRWVVLIAGVLAVIRAAIALVNKTTWGQIDRALGTLFTSSIDVQFLLGIILYFFLSPITRSAFQGFSEAIGNTSLRFFALVHPVSMLLAVAFTHLGGIQSRKAVTDTARHQKALTWFGLALILILLGIPWMRPLLPRL
jgi:hypothetical protein